MAGFNFERDLPHQTKAVNAIFDVFKLFKLEKDPVPALEQVKNPCFEFDDITFGSQVIDLQKLNNINKGRLQIINTRHRVIDVQMETGTGKTYTYTKALFMLNKEFGISKFIIVVPTLSIKAGTVSFLRSVATKEHFKQDYQKILKVHVVESQKNKAKKSYMPQAIVEFVEAQHDKSTIHVLVINAGMINSATLKATSFDTHIFDSYDSPFAALASVKPLTIIDEPHKFPPQKTTWDNIQQLGSQFILRFGATFDDLYYNLIYELTAVEAFNQDLVKGVLTYVEEFEYGQSISIKLLRLYRDQRCENGKSKKLLEPVFELNQNGKTTSFKLIKGESLGKIHPEMAGVTIENHNQTLVQLSNGLELKAGAIINPYSYSESLQDKMMANAVKRHFELERNYLTRPVKIKPLTLFFIDDIEGYRNDHQISGSLKTKFEALVKAQAEQLLETEQDDFYREYLQKTLSDISLTHGGYFSKDNTDSDEKVEQEITEILHDKETLLSLDNPRRFIFSKWTLREGWDNPNVFQICKLRSSGSQTSKLQEVGRGLRLPVNEFMSRVKGEKFDLHYYVDFTESEFTEYLVNEINSKSGFISDQITNLSKDIIERICVIYGLNEIAVLEALDEKGAINRKNDFKPGGFDILKAIYPRLFDSVTGVKEGKIKRGDKSTKTATLRVAKYDELKALWEAINQRVILEYKIDSEIQFQAMLKAFFLNNKAHFKPQGSITRQKRIIFDDNSAFIREEETLDDDVMPLVTMNYKSFILELARALSINMQSLHKVFIDIKQELDINLYLSHPTIRTIRSRFDKYLLDHAFSQYHIGYKKVSNKVHPTVFTSGSGKPLDTIPSSGLGRQFDADKVPADNYLFEQVFYDSDLERDNILSSVKEVTVFTKIPKNSIRIPVAGGGTYSPDFAYVVDYQNGEKSLNLVVETKDKDERDLFVDERQKIKHAEQLFNSFEHGFKVSFETQFKSMAIKNIIKQALARGSA